MHSFSASIQIIDINPYVLVPAAVQKQLFKDAGRNKGPIPVIMTINGFEFNQHLVKFRNRWRLYLNTPMRKAAGIDVGNTGVFTISFDAKERIMPVHPKLAAALKENKKAAKIFHALRPSLQKEILRYINQLKTEESVDINVMKAINFLLGKQRFIGRDKP